MTDGRDVDWLLAIRPDECRAGHFRGFLAALVEIASAEGFFEETRAVAGVARRAVVRAGDGDCVRVLFAALVEIATTPAFFEDTRALVLRARVALRDALASGLDVGGL